MVAAPRQADRGIPSIIESSPTSESGPNREDALTAFRREYAGLEQAILDPVAGVTGISGQEQHLVGDERYAARLLEQAARQFRWQLGEQVSRWEKRVGHSSP
jgi:hypothetical protein